MIFLKKYLVIAVVMILLLLFLVKNAKANTMNTVLQNDKKIKLLPIQVMRNDAAGKGNFGATRSGHIHKGVDLVVTPNSDILAPFDGKVRQANPYANDANYKGLEIAATAGNLKVKIFYCSGFVAGKIYKKGEVLAKAQNIAAKYGGSMKPHIHVEVRVNKIVIDPTHLLLG
jgi:murein DD-endopeptidase MepM/ murein hydrolase activator NlpD